MSTKLNLRPLRKNPRWAGSLKNKGDLAEESELYTFEANQLCYVDSPRAELIVAEVTTGMCLPGTGRPNLRLAILSLLNACFEAFHNEREPEKGAEVGVLWRTSTSEALKSRYKRKLFSPPARKRAATRLEVYGYIKFHKGSKARRDSNSFVPGRVSVVQPTERLRAVYEEVTARAFVVVEPFEDDSELVILKDEEKQLQDYPDCELTNSIRALLRSVNEINHSHRWRFMHRRGELVDMPPSSLTLTRLFKEGSFQVYGRFHCTAQGLRKAERRGITIGGAETVELDFKAMMATVAYAWAGCEWELDAWEFEGDPYELSGYPRNVVKRAFLTCLNAKSRQKAAGALRKQKGFNRPGEVELFINALLAKHSRIEHLFFSSAWKKLFYEESEIMSAMLGRCKQCELPVLAMHDGVVCREVDAVMVADFMRDAFQRRLFVVPRIDIIKDSTGKKAVA